LGNHLVLPYLTNASDLIYYMFGSLFLHQWKETRRSSVFQKSIAVNIILGFIIAYFLLAFLALGFFIDNILQEVYPNQQPEDAFHGFLFYYFLVDLYFRFLLQDLPVMSIQHYLHLPIKKSKLLHYVLLKSLPNLFNLGLLLVFVPFMIKVLIPAYGTGVALTWLGSMVLLTFANNFILIYFKRQLTANPKLTILFGVLIAGLMLLDYFQLLSQLCFSEGPYLPGGTKRAPQQCGSHPRYGFPEPVWGYGQADRPGNEAYLAP
jgi:hypothetical protein